jgi:hypothetical protein
VCSESDMEEAGHHLEVGVRLLKEYLPHEAEVQLYEALSY